MQTLLSSSFEVPIIQYPQSSVENMDCLYTAMWVTLWNLYTTMFILWIIPSEISLDFVDNVDGFVDNWCMKGFVNIYLWISNGIFTIRKSLVMQQ